MSATNHDGDTEVGGIQTETENVEYDVEHAVITRMHDYLVENSERVEAAFQTIDPEFTGFSSEEDFFKARNLLHDLYDSAHANHLNV